MSEELQRHFTPALEGLGGGTIDNSGWQHLLERYVRPSADGLNHVDYRGFQADAKALADYVQLLGGTDIATLGRAEQFAFWCNLYNALTVKVVAEHYPVASIRAISLGGSLVASVTGGPWKAKLAVVGGIALSLDDLEHTILRGTFKDPRLHYAINCGSIGCPNLRTRPFTGTTLDHDLDEAACNFVNSRRGVAIESERLVLSGIFKWYRRDFGGSERHVLAHIAQFADAERRAAIARGLKVDRYEYDWRLNGMDAP